MKKLNLFLAAFLVAVMGITFIGCQKQSIVENDNLANKLDFTKNLKIVNGVIVFNDLQSFKDVMSELNTDKSIKLEEFLKYIGFDNSMYLAENDSDYVAPTTIEDPVIRAIVNEEGVFAIGKEIYKLSGDTEYIISDGNYETIKEIEKGNTENLKNTTKFQITNKIGNKKDFSGQDEYYYQFNTNIRFRLSAWSRNFGLYCSNGIQEECQYRSSLNSSYNVIKMGSGTVTGTTLSGTALLGNPPNWLTLTNSDSEIDSKRVNVTLNWMAGTGIYIITDYINASYVFTYGQITKSSTHTWN